MDSSGAMLAKTLCGYHRGSQVQTPLKHRGDLTVRDLGSEIILYDPKSETFHILNDTARSIWLMIDGKREQKEIRDEFLGLYPKEDPAQLGGDLHRTLEELSRKGLVETS